MFRKALLELKSWCQREVPKPLILRGARQVGKSTLVKMLSQELELDLVEINLEKKTIGQFNNKDDFSIEKVISEIQIATKTRITKNSLLFLDEVQAQPSALNALRYFYEDRPGLKVIAAGSLLEVVANKNNFGMPVGRVEYYYLGPMTFSEFLLALGEDILEEEIRQIGLQHPATSTLQRQAIEFLKEFYYVGGMPEAVKTYAKNRDYLEVRDVQNSLLQTYKDDIPKYSKGREFNNILAVMDYSIHNLGKKVVFSHVLKKTHSTYVKQAIESLALANVIYRTCHNSCSGLPLSAGEDPDIFKLYFLDIGLYNCYMELGWSDLYKLTPDLLLTKGNMAEQFVAQHLAFRQPKKELSKLYYWLRNGKSSAAEVDFVFSHQSKIYPLEVKSGNSGKLRSLWQFVLEKGTKRALRVDLSFRKQATARISHKMVSPAGVQEVNCELIGLPLYAIENLSNFVDE